MSAIGLTGWAADELLSRRTTWLAWPAIFALFGAIAPLFALLAQPHRGAREPLAATTAVDLAGLTVVTGFLYSFFVTTPETGPGGVAPVSLQLVSELAEMQQAGSTTRLLAQVLEQAQDLILVLTPDGRCRYANSSFCRAIGITPEQLTTLRAADLMTLETISTTDLLSQVRTAGGW